MVAAGGTPEREPDWSFSFVDGETGTAPMPPDPIVDELEFAKATLHHQLAAITRTSVHLQSLVHRASRAAMPAEEIAHHAGLSRQTVEAVLAGQPLLEQLFGTGTATPPNTLGGTPGGTENGANPA